MSTASDFDVDLFVMGGGSGGVRAARIAATHGARVAIAEDSRWGGTCVVRGCVPKKLMVYASEVRAMVDDARSYGWDIGPIKHDWATFIAAKDREIARLSSLYVGNLAKAGVQILDGRASFCEPHLIEVTAVDGTTTRVRAAHVLIATGGTPRMPRCAGTELVITSDQAFEMTALPRRIAVIGGGYIGVEFAHIFTGLGAEVTLVHRGDRVLPGFDDDVRTVIEDGLGRAGIRLRAATEPRGFRRHGDAIVVETASAAIEVDLVMAAIGRLPATGGLGLAAIDVMLDVRGAVIVDEWSRTSIPHIYAVGDVTGRQALTPVAIREGHAFADTVFGDRPTPVHHNLIPTAVFAQPPGAAIGLTEHAARAQGLDVQIYATKFRPMRHSITGRPEQTLIKLVVDRSNRRVLGVHMVGDDAAEIIQAAAIAVTMGATKDDFDRTFAVHPTAAEELVLLR